MNVVIITPICQLWGRFLRLVERALDAFFHFPKDWYSWMISILTVLALFGWGVSLWGTFFSWGNIALDFLDWAEVTGPRYALLRDAAAQGILPLHADNLTALRGITDRYFSIADTPFSPQYLLLPYFGTAEYLFYDILLFYGIGFLSLLLLAYKYRLSPFTFSLIFILFYFNGYITSHFAAGHANWTAHFLLLFFVMLVLDLLEHEKINWRRVLGMAVLMAVLLAQGGFHLFVWCMMFLALLALFNWRLIKPVFLSGLFAVLFCLPRLLPPVLVLSELNNEYLGGFASVTDLIDSMIILRDPYRAVHALTDTFPLNVWETDFYIGFLGLVFLVVCGVILPILRNHSRTSLQMQILIASLIVTVFSIGDIFGQVVRVFTIPPLTGERVTSRMFILPLVFVLVLAAVFIQRELDKRSIAAWIEIIGIGLAAVIFHDLNQHLMAWRVRYLDPMVDLFPKVPFDPAQHTLANHPDLVYTSLLLGGMAVAVLSLVFLIFMSLRRNARRSIS